MELETIYYDQGTPELIKDYREIFVYTDKGESASLFISFDQGPWYAVAQVNQFDSRVKPIDPKFPGKTFTGRSYAIKVTQNDGGQAVIYQGNSCIYTERRQQ